MNNEMNQPTTPLSPQMMPQQMPPQVNSPYVAPTQPKPAAPKKKLSGIAVFSMIFAIIFAIAASCMSFLPILDITVADRNNAANKTHSAPTLLDYTSFGDFGRMDDKEYSANLSKGKTNDEITSLMTTYTFGQTAKFYNTQAQGDESIYTNEGKLFVILSTVLFFTMFGAALFVLLGKLLSKTGGGRVMAFIFSLIGLLCSGGYLAYLFILMSNAVKSEIIPQTVLYTVAPGYGMILQTSFALLTFIFCCMALSKKSALKDKVPKAPPAVNYAGVPAANNMQNVVNPVIDPNTMGVPQTTIPATNYAPQQSYAPAPAPVPAPSPVPAPAPVSATEDTLSFEIPNVPQQAPAAAPAPAPAPVPEEQPASYAPVEQPAPAAGGIGKIEGIGGDYHGVVIDLNPGEKITIGSDPSCSNIVLTSDEGDVSPAHCTVSFEADIDNYKVTDTSSTGTFFNGKKLPQNRGIFLPRGTVLSFGSCETSFRLQ